MVYRNAPLAPGVAFVTGGARGLGNAVAVAFAKEGARAVVLVDVNDEETMNAGKKSVEEYGAEVISLRRSMNSFSNS
jgi:NAD(P)-dependent dehydrogenase (short-subunit alcohol dehydrogenase family)